MTQATSLRRAASRAGLVAVLALFVAALLAGCRGSPALGDAAGAAVIAEEQAVYLPFVTNRVIEEGWDGERRFGNEPGPLSSGRCTVALGKGLRDTRLLAASELALPRTLDEVAARPEGSVVVYFHGYYEDFERSCRRAAIFRQRLALDAGFLLFSWPANSTPFTYTDDVRDLEASVPAFQAFLASAGSRFGPRRVSIVAHSLGSRGVVQALRSLPGSGERFRDLVLLAADMDRERFLEALPALEAQVERVSVLVSSRDRALRLSEALNQAQRLGQSLQETVPGVLVRDVTNVADSHFSGHIYHLRNADVVTIIRQLLQREP